MYADLHIHSVLSPCADRNMLPQYVFPKVKESGIDIFAICDHNSGWNVRAFYNFGRQFYPEIFVIPGIEITCREEIHIVALFPGIDEVEAISSILEDLLPEVEMHPDFYFPQYIINPDGNPIREVSKPLYYAISLSLEDTVNLVKEHKGIAIPAHIDRPSFSIISQLGFIPRNLFEVVEVSPRCVRQIIIDRNIKMRDANFLIPEDLTIVSYSDAHSLDEIGIVRTKLNFNFYDFDSFLDVLKYQPEIEVANDD